MLFQQTVFKRNEECLALERALKFFPVVHLTGIEGVGKSTLVQDLLSNLKVPNHWYTLSNHLTLQELAGQRDLEIDDAISTLVQQVQKMTGHVIVWDNLHVLSPANQKKLIFEISNSCPQQKNLFLSDEDITPIKNEPVVRLGPLDFTNTKHFFSFFGVDYSEKQINLIFKQTGGIIAQLKLCLLDPESGVDPEQYLKTLSVPAIHAIQVLAFSPTTLFESDLRNDQPDSLSFAVETLKELERKYLVEFNKDHTILCREFIREGLRKSVDPTMAQKYRTQAAKLVLKRQGLDLITKLTCLLELSDLENAFVESQNLSLDHIEELNPNQLSNFGRILYENKKDLFGTQAWRLTRAYIHCLILQNKRSEAIEFCVHFLNQAKWDEFQEEQFLSAYDAFYWVNRSKESTKLDSLRSRIMNLSKKPIQFLFQIEQSFLVSQIQKKPRDSITTFLRILAEIESALKVGKVQDKDILILARGNCAFQLGIQFMEVQGYPDAIRYFELARDSFQSLKRKYLELFCEFNVCLILSYERRPERVHDKLQKLRTSSQIYGFPYLQAGVCLLLAEQHMDKLEFQKALSFIDEAQGRLDGGMPQNSQLAILTARIRILGQLRLQTTLKESIQDLSDRFGKLQKPLIDLLSIETQLDYRPVEDIVEKLEEETLKDEDTTYLDYYMLQRGVLPPGKKIESFLSEGLQAMSAALEFKIINAIQSRDIELVQSQVFELIGLLKSSNESSLVKIAASIFSLSMQTQKPERSFADLYKDVQLGPWTDSEKSFFQGWLSCVQAGRLFDRAAQLKVASSKDIERWGLWVLNTEVQMQVLVTNEGTMEIQAQDVDLNQPGIFLIERHNEVYFNGQAIPSFTKKPVLIQILSAILNSYPEHLSKSTLSSLLWPQAYDPSVHDARIYTSMQRIRDLLQDHVIENWKNGYRWSQKVPFAILKDNKATGLRHNRLQNLFVEFFKKRAQDVDPKLHWVTKKDLTEQIETSDATAKRTLAVLLKDGLIERTGRGSMIKYKIKSR